MKKTSKKTPAKKEKESPTHDNGFGITMREAEIMNAACTKWLRARGLLYDHESIKSFLFGSPPQ